jgi:hypothetical protein
VADACFNCTDAASVPEAAWATDAIVSEIWEAEVEASLTRLAISVVATTCSSSEAEMIAALSLMRPIAELTPSMAEATPEVAWRMEFTWSAIESVAAAVSWERTLTLVGNDGESAAGVSGSRRLQRCVQSQQLGLACDLVDQAHHRLDLARGITQSPDRGGCLARLLDRLRGEISGLRGLPGDFGKWDAVNSSQAAATALTLEAVALAEAATVSDKRLGLLRVPKNLRRRLVQGLGRRRDRLGGVMHAVRDLGAFGFEFADPIGVALHLQGGLIDSQGRVAIGAGKAPEQDRTMKPAVGALGHGGGGFPDVGVGNVQQMVDGPAKAEDFRMIGQTDHAGFEIPIGGAFAGVSNRRQSPGSWFRNRGWRGLNSISCDGSKGGVFRKAKDELAVVDAGGLELPLEKRG